MNYNGRRIDPVRVWESYVEFPSSMRLEEDDPFLPKVQCPNPSHDTLKQHFQINCQEPLVHCFAACGISGTWEHAICVIEGLYEKFKVEDAKDDRERRQRRSRARREAERIILRAARGGRHTGGGISSNGRRGTASRLAASGARAKESLSADQLRYESFLPQVALEYLTERGISSASTAAWRIGWDKAEKRLVIPAHDERDILKFLIKRGVLPNQFPKYLYSEGFPKTALLFGAGQLDLGLVKSHGLIIVEGSLDTILNHQHGLRNTVGVLGTGISEQQRKIVARINPPRIYLMFDKDAAGVHSIEIAAPKLKKYPLYVVRYPKGKSDPAEMTEAEKLRQVERAIPIRNFFSHPSVSRTRKEVHG